MARGIKQWSQGPIRAVHARVVGWAVLLLLAPVGASLARAIEVATPPQLEPVPYSTTQGRQQQRRRPLSLEQAVAIATERFPGQVVRAETISQNGRAVHEIRILNEGRVRTVHVDAESGNLR